MLAKRTSDKPSRTGVRFSPEPTPTMPTQEPATPTAKPKVLAKPKALLKNIKPSAKPTKATSKKKAETPKKPQPVAKKKVSPKVKKDTSSISLKKCGSSAVESGLTQDAIRVHRAVCNKFPSISSYGGMRAGDSDSYHSKGRALDIMCTGATGDAVSSWLKANYKKLGVMELIWKQHIWTVQRSSEGWRPMTDRGSITANHYDHVHVSTYVDSGAL
jgi:outer membrane biosynthesis protein TonB